MASILLVPFAPPGHAEPMVALGTALRRHGHDVSVFTERPESVPGGDGGLRALAPDRWRSEGAVPASLLASGDGAALFQYLFFGSVVDMTRDIQDAATRCGAELIVSDVIMPGGGLAARLSGLPWVSLSCSPFPALDAYRIYLAPPVAAYFDAAPTLARLGLPAGGGDNLLGRISPVLHLIQTTPRFAGFPDLPGPVALVGPLVPGPTAAGRPRAAPDDRRRDRPTVAVTASTASRAALGGRTFKQDRYLRTVVAALDGLDVDAVVTLPAGLEPGAVGPAPPNVRLTGNVSHDTLFDRCAAVVCHAGWGTVTRALVRGLPLVLAPICADQPYVAQRCAELGLATALDPATMRVADVRHAVREVCQQDRYRVAAEQFAAEVAAAAPLDSCASLITSLLDAERLPTWPLTTPPRESSSWSPLASSRCSPG